jgi:K+-transporting ATPase ATPase C chain
VKNIIISLKALLVFTILTGIIYPLFITGIAQTIFPHKANGSLIINNNQIIGSELIGQQSDSTIYFASRPSSIAYNPLPSGGSNLGPTSSVLKQLVEERKHHFIVFNHLDSLTPVPSEMVFASASGLDPHISPEAALLQINRIASARNFSDFQKQNLIQCVTKLTEPPQLNCLGKERINVLLLNLELDKIARDKK